MKFLSMFVMMSCLSLTVLQSAPSRPYRLDAVDLKSRVIWGAKCLAPEGQGLAFGGQDQDAEDGRPHTRVLRDGEWVSIVKELRAANPLQALHDRAWALRNEAKAIRARLRHLYFKGKGVEASDTAQLDQFKKALTELTRTLDMQAGDDYAGDQCRISYNYLVAARCLLLKLSGLKASDLVKTDYLMRLHQAQIQMAMASEALDAEPPPRAMHHDQAIVFDPETHLYIIFGGDHLDYLTNDTWVFDAEEPKWYQQHPSEAPPPRANHRLSVLPDGKIQMRGGYTYASNTDYCGGQYIDLNDGVWTYHVLENHWSGNDNALVQADTRVYRKGPFHPDFFLQGEAPDPDAFEAFLEALPVNQWVAADPPCKPRLNRDWGTARFDPDRDMMLRWSGGHSAHGGTDVLHYHFSTNRWELPFPVEFPLGQLYSNTSYPRGFNFNRRPWMTGHTYQNYAYDPPSRQMVKAGRPRHYYLYDPDAGDWVGRGKKPAAMQYNSCFYDLTLAATPKGAVCWDKHARIHRFDAASGAWRELTTTGDKLPGAVVDNSTIAYDSCRDRMLMISKRYGKPPFSGQVHAFDLKTRKVTALSPAGMDWAHAFAYIDRCVYVPTEDILFLASYLTDGDGHTPTPAYDCAANRWIKLDIGYGLGKRHGRTTRAFPHGRSCGILFDTRRKLIWGTDTNGQVYSLRLDRRSAEVK